MTTCLISFNYFFLGTSAAQTIAVADKVEQNPSTGQESVCQPGPKTMQQHIEKGAVTSGRGKGKMSGKKDDSESHAEFNVQVQ